MSNGNVQSISVQLELPRVRTRTWLCNLSLLNIKNSPTLQDVSSDRSISATIFEYFYDLALEDALTDFPWKFATKESNLEDEQVVNNNGWAYNYAKPIGYLQGQSIFSGRLTDSYYTKVPYDVFLNDNDIERIFTKERYKRIKYTKLITDLDTFPASFIFALSFKLSILIAPRLTLGDDKKLNEDLQNKYLFAVNSAKLKNAIIGVEDKQPMSSYDNARWS